MGKRTLLNKALGVGAALLCLTFGLGPVCQAETFKVGAIAPLSGPGAPWGLSLVRGTQLAIDDINNAGGLKIGGKKYKVELVEYDDKYTGAGGVQAANRLLSVDKVKMIVGSISSASVLAFTPLTEKAKVLTLINGYAKKSVNPKNTYAFRVLQTSTESAKVIIPYVLKKHPGIKKVALIGPNDESGQDLSATDAAEYKAQAREIVYNEFYERSQKDFYPQLTKLLSKKPDLIDTSASSPGTTGLIAKQARALGYKGYFLTSSGFFTKPTVAVAGKAAEGFYFAVQADLNSDASKIKMFNTKYEAKYHEKCDQWSSPLWYNAVLMVFHLMEKEKTTDPSKIKMALEKMDSWEGCHGKLFFGGKEIYGIDHQVMGSMFISTVKDGKEKILDLVSYK